jgi:hypothetical protein
VNEAGFELYPLPARDNPCAGTVSSSFIHQGSATNKHKNPRGRAKKYLTQKQRQS